MKNNKQIYFNVPALLIGIYLNCSTRNHEPLIHHLFNRLGFSSSVINSFYFFIATLFLTILLSVVIGSSYKNLYGNKLLTLSFIQKVLNVILIYFAIRMILFYL